MGRFRVGTGARSVFGWSADTVGDVFNFLLHVKHLRFERVGFFWRVEFCPLPKRVGYDETMEEGGEGVLVGRCDGRVEVPCLIVVSEFVGLWLGDRRIVWHQLVFEDGVKQGAPLFAVAHGDVGEVFGLVYLCLVLHVRILVEACCGECVCLLFDVVEQMGKLQLYHIQFLFCGKGNLICRCGFAHLRIVACVNGQTEGAKSGYLCRKIL